MPYFNTCHKFFQAKRFNLSAKRFTASDALLLKRPEVVLMQITRYNTPGHIQCMCINKPGMTSRGMVSGSLSNGMTGTCVVCVVTIKSRPANKLSIGIHPGPRRVFCSFIVGHKNLENFENPWIKSLKIAIIHNRFVIRIEDDLSIVTIHDRFVIRIRWFVYFNIFFLWKK